MPQRALLLQPRRAGGGNPRRRGVPRAQAQGRVRERRGCWYPVVIHHDNVSAVVLHQHPLAARLLLEAIEYPSAIRRNRKAPDRRFFYRGEVPYGVRSEAVLPASYQGKRHYATPI
jgi:hypothetical protein